VKELSAVRHLETRRDEVRWKVWPPSTLQESGVAVLGLAERTREVRAHARCSVNLVGRQTEAWRAHARCSVDIVGRQTEALRALARCSLPTASRQTVFVQSRIWDRGRKDSLEVTVFPAPDPAAAPNHSVRLESPTKAFLEARPGSRKGLQFRVVHRGLIDLL
jgi:hypothetical protein